MTQPIYTDPASGRQYTVDPVTGQTSWVDTPPPPMTPAGPPQPYYPTPSVTVHQTVTTGREGPRHGLHLLGTVLTCGAWAPVWLGITVVHATAREVTVTGPDGRPTVRRKARPEVVVGLVVGFLVLAGIGAAINPTTTTTPASVPAPLAVAGSSSSSAPGSAEAPAPAATSKAPAATSKAPVGTVSQRNALRKAESYLEFKGFSRKGLIHQLSSDAGEGFSVADATWAVDHLSGVNWNEQAVRCGKSYLDMMGFSRSGLIQQLSSDSGEQFTKAQATYAANKLGL